MDWNLLRLFVDVVDAGSMSAAARRHGITRSSVSQRVRQLEDEMQAQLLRRTTRSLRPTEIGQTLYEHGRQIAHQFEAAQHDVASLGSTLSGLVRISLPTGIGHSHVAPALAEFLGRHPQLSLSVTFSNRLTDMIDANVDIALRIMSHPPDDVVARELCGVPWHLYCSPDYLERAGSLDGPEALQRASFLTSYGSRHVDLPLVRDGKREVVRLQPRLVSESVTFLRDCVLQHLGIALLPHYVMQGLEAEGRVARVLPDYICTNHDSRIWILTLPNRFPTPAMNAVIALLRETVLAAIGPGTSHTLSSLR